MSGWKIVALCVFAALAVCFLSQPSSAQDRPMVPVVGIEWQRGVGAVRIGPSAIQMPWRRGVEANEKKLVNGQADLGQQLGQIKSEQASLRGDVAAIRQLLEQKQAAPEEPVAAPAPVSFGERIEAKKAEVRAEVQEKVDSLLESPILKHLAIFLCIGLVLALGHAIYVKCHADRKAIAAKLAAVPVVGSQLAAGFLSQDAFNTAVDAKVQAAKDALQVKVDALKDKAHAETVTVALATPAPSQAAPAPAAK
jgi:hypothetical protein